jgi:hypothetical protein
MEETTETPCPNDVLAQLDVFDQTGKKNSEK